MNRLCGPAGRKRRTMDGWLYDESKHCGVDYSKAEQARAYEERHRKFRDFRKEFDDMMAFLELSHPERQSLVDLGCGTGAMAIYAAEVFGQVTGVDISEAMLAQARAKSGAGVANLTFVQGGFLSYTHAGGAADVVTTKAAFHHLPDFWKQVALLRINRMLKPGGVLYLHDVVFRFEPHAYAEQIHAWVERLGAVAGEALRRDVEAHIRDEYSTFDWVLRGLLERAGFAVEKERSADGFLCEYACRKVREIPTA